RSSRDLQETRSHVAVRASRIRKYTDDRPLCLQKVDDLSLGLDGRPTSVNPDGEAVPGGRLVQSTRQKPIVTDRNRHDVPRKVTECAEAVEFVRVPCKADDRPRSLLEQTDQLRRVWLPLNSSGPVRGVQATRDCEIRKVDQGLEKNVEHSSLMRCI